MFIINYENLGRKEERLILSIIKKEEGYYKQETRENDTMVWFTLKNIGYLSEEFANKYKNTKLGDYWEEFNKDLDQIKLTLNYEDDLNKIIEERNFVKGSALFLEEQLKKNGFKEKELILNSIEEDTCTTK